MLGFPCRPPPIAFVGMRRIEMRGPRNGAWAVDVPRTRRERVRGLRRRDPRLDEGLLLERCRSVHTRGMRVPITVAFLDAVWRVIRVERAPAGRVLFCRRARHTFECHVGADLRVGDVLSPR